MVYLVGEEIVEMQMGQVVRLKTLISYIISLRMPIDVNVPKTDLNEPAELELNETDQI